MDGLTLTRSLRATELCDPTGPDPWACKGRQEYARNGGWVNRRQVPPLFPVVSPRRRRRPGNSEVTLLELPAIGFYFGTRPR